MHAGSPKHTAPHMETLDVWAINTQHVYRGVPNWIDQEKSVSVPRTRCLFMSLWRLCWFFVFVFLMSVLLGYNLPRIKFILFFLKCYEFWQMKPQSISRTCWLPPTSLEPLYSPPPPISLAITDRSSRGLFVQVYKPDEVFASETLCSSQGVWNVTHNGTWTLAHQCTRPTRL